MLPGAIELFYLPTASHDAEAIITTLLIACLANATRVSAASYLSIFPNTLLRLAPFTKVRRDAGPISSGATETIPEQRPARRAISLVRAGYFDASAVARSNRDAFTCDGYAA